jgi:hypothetical protein
MARYMSKLVVGAVLAGGAALAAGCHADGDHHGHGDPCWPDRYENESRAALVANFQPQVENGQVLDQTVWNTHFENGTDKLNGAGMDKLDQIARRRPHPDPRVFIQTARDMIYDAGKPEEYAAKRQELDTRRVAAVQKYLSATLTGRSATFDVQVHDPAVPGIDGAAPRILIPTPAQRVSGPVSVPAGQIAPGAGGGANSGTTAGSTTGGSGGGSHP